MPTGRVWPVPVERAEGATRGPELVARSDDARKSSRMLCWSIYNMNVYLSEVSRDKSRDMAGEVGRDPLLHVPPSKHGDFHVA